MKPLLLCVSSSRAGSISPDMVNLSKMTALLACALLSMVSLRTTCPPLSSLADAPPRRLYQKLLTVAALHAPANYAHAHTCMYMHAGNQSISVWKGSAIFLHSSYPATYCSHVRTATSDYLSNNSLYHSMLNSTLDDHDHRVSFLFIYTRL